MLDRGQEHSDRWAVVGYAVHPPRRGMIVNEKSTAKRSERETLLLLYSMHHQEVSEEEIFLGITAAVVITHISSSSSLFFCFDCFFLKIIQNGIDSFQRIIYSQKST